MSETFTAQGITSITQRFEFDSAHRVLRHQGKCRHLHGHRYVAEVTVWCPQLDHLGMITDFSHLKSSIGGWINAYWDHNIILHPDDPLPKLGKLMAEQGIWVDQNAWNDGKRPYLLSQFMDCRKTPSEFFNPTVENMARELYFAAQYTMDQLVHFRRDNEDFLLQLNVSKVRLYETPNCWAVYVPFGKSEEPENPPKTASKKREGKR